VILSHPRSPERNLAQASIISSTVIFSPSIRGDRALILFPWHERAFAKTHTEIACDPQVWSQVEALIRQQIGQSMRGEDHSHD
jgi:hypothetical protein